MNTFLRIVISVLASMSGWACSPDPIYGSCLRGDLEMAKLTIATKPDLSQDKKVEYIIGSAAGGHRELVRFWYDHGCDTPKALGEALHAAARCGRLETTRLLLELGADPKYSTGLVTDWTPIHSMVGGAGQDPRQFQNIPTGEPMQYLLTLQLLYARDTTVPRESFRTFADGRLYGAAAARNPDLMAAVEFLQRNQEEALRGKRDRVSAEEFAQSAGEFSQALDQLSESLAILDLDRRAQAGDPVALRQMGDLFAEGRESFGLKKNDSSAIECWKRAARLGDAEAQERLRTRGIKWPESK